MNFGGMYLSQHFVRLDYVLIIVAVLIVVAIIISLIMYRRIGKNVSDLHSKVEGEKVKYNVLKQQMSNNIAHELRTPVSSIRGYLETLSTCKDIAPERKQQYIERAYAQSVRLSDLIRDIAMITKIEETPNRLTKQELNIKSIVVDVIDEFKDVIRVRGVIIENMLPDDLVIVGNRTLFDSIFRNLIENSLKYAGAFITIHIEYMGFHTGKCYFKYYDTGKGVSSEHQKRIFERFYRVSEGRTRDDGGSGLGLSIVRNAIAFHGGEISAYHHHGGGLEYKFSMKKG